MAAVPTDLIQGVLIGTFRTIDGDRRNTFKRGADSFPQIDRDCFVIEGGNLQRFMGILGAGFTAGERLKLGTFVADRTAEAIASGDKFFQRHAAILGSTGSGKSWAVALILERAAKLKFPNIIVFDMHGEYAPLANKAAGGFAERFRIAGPGDLEKPGDDTLFLPYWLLNRDEMLSMILDRSDQNAPNQASRFTLHVRSLKGQTLDSESKTGIKKTYTVDSPIPYDVKKLVGLLNADNTTKGVGKTGPVKGEWEDKLTRFLSRLEAKLDDRRYGFMFAPPPPAMKYDWLASQVLKLLRSGDGTGIKVIDFSEVPADVLPVVTGTLARLLYDVQFWMGAESRTPVTLLCDEAHLYLPVRDDAECSAAPSARFVRAHREGRPQVRILASCGQPAPVGCQQNDPQPVQQLPSTASDKRDRSRRHQAINAGLSRGLDQHLAAARYRRGTIVGRRGSFADANQARRSQTSARQRHARFLEGMGGLQT
nr:ATP-binding protein [Candidatus Rhodoblastus alkanivorans]